jgi:quinoprotein glucose dehydrogenase
MFSRITHWLFAVVLSLVGLLLSVLGGYLAYLGGSLYYVMTGVAVIAVTVLYVRENPLAAKLYAVILAITLPWAIYESGLDLLALLPRLGLWMGLSLWFLTAWYRRRLDLKKKGASHGLMPWLIAPNVASVIVLLLAGSQGYEMAVVPSGILAQIMLSRQRIGSTMATAREAPVLRKSSKSIGTM